MRHTRELREIPAGPSPRPGRADRGLGPRINRL